MIILNLNYTEKIKITLDIDVLKQIAHLILLSNKHKITVKFEFSLIKMATVMNVVSSNINRFNKRFKISNKY